MFQRKSLISAVLVVLIAGLTLPTSKAEVPAPEAHKAEIAAVTLSGVVVDATTDRPVANVNVKVPVTGEEAKTDKNGKFTFENMNPGRYTIQINHMGYKKFSKRVEIMQSDQNKQLVLKLEPESEINR